MQRALDGAEDELASAPKDDLRRRAVKDARSAIGTLGRIPAALVGAAAELKTEGQAVWAAARAANDFAAFAPVLRRTMAMQREIADHIGHAGHPYDALVGTYEPGMTWARLQGLFAELRAGIAPLLDKARGIPVRGDILTRRYPVDRQKAFSGRIAARMGYDFGRGRLDDTVHPFEISFTRQDVRITGRFREDWLPGGLFAVWHEAGHGIYEQGVAPAFSRSVFTTDFVNLYAVGGASFGMHESQSRLWENRVGRSRRFWDRHFAELRKTFPEQLADVSVRDFWKSVNAARPSFIRVEADELTYDLHIMLRCEIEAALIDGSLDAADLPAVWKEKMRDHLGVTVPNDTLGVLQDVHWSSGMVGSFPTYTLGNVMASQLFRAACAIPEVEAGLDAGDHGPLRAWLEANVLSHGRSRAPDEILHAATGKGLSTEDYIADLSRKVAELAN
jgi:carboxypeptidase Taq